MSQYALIYCAILSPWKKVLWTAASISPSSCHNSCSGIIPHTSLLLSGHNIHMNLIVIKHMITSVIDKLFGLVDTEQSWLDGNKTPSAASMVLLSLGLIAAREFLHRLNIYRILPLLHEILHLYSNLEVWYLQCSIYNVYIIFIYWLKALLPYIYLHICKLNWYITEESSL